MKRGKLIFAPCRYVNFPLSYRILETTVKVAGTIYAVCASCTYMKAAIVIADYVRRSRSRIDTIIDISLPIIERS